MNDFTINGYGHFHQFIVLNGRIPIGDFSDNILENLGFDAGLFFSSELLQFTGEDHYCHWLAILDQSKNPRGGAR